MIGDAQVLRFDWMGGAFFNMIGKDDLEARLLDAAPDGAPDGFYMVKFANNAREQALNAERHTYEVALVVRNASTNLAQSEAALARFVLDENVKPNGNLYASDWQLAGYQIDPCPPVQPRPRSDSRRRPSQWTGQPSHWLYRPEVGYR